MQSQVRLVRKCDECFRPRQTDPEDQDCAQALAPDINTALKMSEMCFIRNCQNTKKIELDSLSHANDKNILQK